MLPSERAGAILVTVVFGGCHGGRHQVDVRRRFGRNFKIFARRAVSSSGRGRHGFCTGSAPSRPRRTRNRTGILHESHDGTWLGGHVECEDMVSVDVDRTLQVTIKRCCFFVVTLLVNTSSLPHLRSADRRRPADCMQSSVHLTCMYTRIKSSLVPNLATDCSLIMLTEAALECLLTSAGRMVGASRGA